MSAISWLLLLAGVLESFATEWNTQDYMKREHSLIRPYQGSPIVIYPTVTRDISCRAPTRKGFTCSFLFSRNPRGPVHYGFETTNAENFTFFYSSVNERNTYVFYICVVARLVNIHRSKSRFLFFLKETCELQIFKF